MKLFAFGLGYCARAAIARGDAVEASGTVRSPEAAAALRREGIEAFVFEGENFDAGLLDALARAELLLISAAPEPTGDPVLARFSREILAAPDLKRILYLSTIGVYGNWGGAWNRQHGWYPPVSSDFSRDTPFASSDQHVKPNHLTGRIQTECGGCEEHWDGTV